MTAPTVAAPSGPWRAASRAVSATAGRLPGAWVVRAARRVPSPVLDGALAAGFLAALLIEQARSAPLPGTRLALAIALDVTIAGSLALRRRVPLTAYTLGSFALAAGALWTSRSGVAPYANMISTYSLGLYARRARAWWGLLLVFLGVLVYFSRAAQGGTQGAAPAGVLLSWVLAWAVGYSSARRREEQEAARYAMRRQAVAEERSRLARELHDLVGHTVNVMVVQAGAARLMLDRDLAKAREIVTGLEFTGRQALTELDRMLGVLRRDSLHADGPAPPDEVLSMPRIADLPRLAQRMTEAGIRVTIRIDPSFPQVARSIEMSAYRIAQEALTNSLKHGGAHSAVVSVRLDGPALNIAVTDDGSGPPDGYQPGRGLLGIAERVSAFGGSLQHGRSDQGGFQLLATLPLS
jgi:signal transduction histidine kinase